LKAKYFKFIILIMSQETFETTTAHKIHVLHAKSCLRIIIGVDLKLQIQLQHETLKLMLKLMVGSEKNLKPDSKIS